MKVFEEVTFLLKYHQNSPSPQATEHKKKKREKLLKKEERKKRGRKRKAPRVSSNKREVNILRGEKHFNFKNILFHVIPFSPHPSYHLKNPFQNH
jgi:hypothetical protein